MTSLFLLTILLSGTPRPSSSAKPAEAASSRIFAAEAPAGEQTPEAVQQRRRDFVRLVKMGLFERFDEARQEAVFKRSDPPRSVHDPGPLEDEAIASAAREALAADYAKLGLKPRLTCTAGKLSLGNLPDDPAKAAAVIDTILTLDGVQTVAAALPPPLRMP